MEYQVVINCGKGPDSYCVYLTAKNKDIFHSVKDDPSVKGKEGEELVTAILAAAPHGILIVERLKDGLRNDGANSEPALLVFRDDGYVEEEHCQNNLTNDGAKGEPAVQLRNGNGELVAASRYKNSRLIKELSIQEIANYLASIPRQQPPKKARAHSHQLNLLTSH